MLALVINVTIVLLGLGLLVLIGRGRVQLASVLFSSATWAINTLAALLSGGVSGPTFSSYLLVILTTGLLLGGRAAIAFAGLSIMAGSGMFYAEISSVLPPSLEPITPASTWILQSMYFCPITDLGQSVDQSERVLLNASGESIPILKSVIPTILGGRRYLIENFLDITDRKRAEEQIQASLREKEVLLKEIHHRVRNNLQVISSLLYLRSKNIKDREALEVFQDSQNRVRSMALVPERLYQSQDLARVDFAEYVRSLANYLFRSYGVHSNVIQLKINMDDVSLGIDAAVPYGLILNELVSNSLKHAFPGGREGEIRIELRSDHDNKFTLMVSDNGLGFPQDLDFRNTESLGLQLVNTLVDQLEGTIELDRSGGTAFEITFTELK